ncbi:MAG: DMT family transporter [Hamadaea sp.]|uniref:DMT family transporter n=1 Tax=Hamadaea sp. TaxID=2024425 RepID=UPI0018074E10|nr:DMT family transporter [Hamadaea sp.]NUT21261.1 DMT family transporter [Hamadaea sp.]
MGRAAALTSVLIWGVQFSVLAAALRQLDAYHFSSLRFVLGALVIAAVLVWREGRGALRYEGRLLAATGYGAAGFAAFSILLIVALGYTSPQNVALVAATSPILTQLLRWALDGVRPHPAILALAVAALAGLALVITKGHLGGFGAFGLGDLMALGAALGWSIFTYGAGKFPGWSPLRYTALTMIGGAVVTVAVTAVADLTGLAHLPSAAAVWSVTPHLVYVAVVGSVVAALVWTVAVRSLGATTAVLFINLTPIVALVIAVIGGARLSPAELTGAAVTVVALLGATAVHRRVSAPAAARVPQVPVRSQA